MKAILKQIRNSSLPTFVTAAVLLLCSPFCHVARAQSDNSFSSEQIPTDLIRDNDVVPTDFQQDFAKRAENAFGEARESVTATLDQAEPALDEWTRSLEATTQKLLPADGSMPWVEDIQRQASTIQLPKVLGSLAIVIGGYLGFVWFSRKLMGEEVNTGLPKEVIEVLGETPFGPRKSLQLVRLGSKLLLLMHSPDGTSPVGEITDPHEVEYLTSLCGGRKNSRSAIAIRKASAASTTTTNNTPNGGGDLKRILRQLERSGVQGSNAVFEA